MRDGMYQIGEAASRVGLSLRTVRYYEEVGLVVPSGRTQGGFRLYTEVDIDRLALVKQLKPLDFTLEEMRDLLEVRAKLADENLDPDARDELALRLGAYAEVAKQRSTILRDQLAAVQTVTRALQQEVQAARAARSQR